MSTSPNKVVQRIMTGVFICFFLSGATGLIYEILWIRLLGLLFGHTVHAITTVLVAFMGGLAIGSYLCGRYVDRMPNLLRTYGILEIGIGIYCLLTPLLIHFIQWVYLPLAKAGELSFTTFTLIQFLLASAILVPPTALMGATLPILSRFLVKDMGSVGSRVGKLYAFNTFGAVFGTYLAGFLLLPVMGTQITLLFAAVLNIGIGLLAIVFDKHLQSVTQSTPVSADRSPGLNESLSVHPSASKNLVGGSRPSSRPSWDRRCWYLVIGLAVSGGAAMVYQIAWTRALSLIIGSSTYAFSAILLAFLVGIAGGSALFSRIAKGRKVEESWFFGMQLGIGVSAALVLPLFSLLPEFFLTVFQFSSSYGFVLLIQIVICFIVMIIPTLFIGATFPCVIQLISKDLSRLGKEVGTIYAFNTLGAIIGSFAAGFILIPVIGVELTIKVAILMNLLLAATLFFAFSSRKISLRWAMGMSAAVAASVLFIPTWNQGLMSSGVAVYAPMYLVDHQKISLRDRADKYKLLYYKDGISATVSVHDSGKNIFLRVNGKTDASTGGDMHTQLMSGHLPALLHPNPKSGLIIGMGSGITVGAVAQHGLESIDVVEIEPGVVEATSFFKKENRDVLSDPRVRVHIADGRNFLLTSDDQYDVLISEPSNPWIGGLASLFTVEFFNLARQHLSENGVMVQWFHGYGIAPEDVKMVAASFRKVFPHATLWMINQGDFLLVGTKSPLIVDLNRIRLVYEENPTFKADMERLGFQSHYSILADFYLNEEDLARFSRGSDLNTDDRLPLEFSAPRSLYTSTTNLNLQALEQAKRSQYPSLSGATVEDLNHPKIQYDLGMSYMHRKLFKQAEERFLAAVAGDPQYYAALIELGRLNLKRNHVLEAIDNLQRVVKAEPEQAEAHYLLGMTYLRQNQSDKAAGFLRKSVDLNPENIDYRMELATAYRQIKDLDKAIDQYQVVLTKTPENHRIMGALGATLIAMKEPSEAVQILDKALEIESNDHRLHYQLGEAFLLLDRNVDAQTEFESAIQIEGADPEPYVGMGKAWLALGDRARAVDYFKQATEINPRVHIPEI